MTTTYIVMIATDRGTDWLTEADDIEAAVTLRDEWLGDTLRDEDDRAWITPTVGGMLAPPAHRINLQQVEAA